MSSRRGRRGRLVLVPILAFVLALAGAGCGSATMSVSSASAPVGPSGSAVPSDTAASASSATVPADSSGAASLPPPAGSPSAAASPAIAIDPSLLDVLPAQLDGLDRQRDPAVEAGSFADPTLATIGTAGVTALYIDPSTAQFAYVVLIHLKGSGLADVSYRQWRDSFDAGACAQAGGVGGHAQSTIAGHDTYIGTCSGGLTTYHTILASRGLLVSVSSVGDRRLGEQLVKALPS